jgi:hypothetical protein
MIEDDDRIKRYETESGMIYSPNGPQISQCRHCGELIQYRDSHERVCEALQQPTLGHGPKSARWIPK